METEYWGLLYLWGWLVSWAGYLDQGDDRHAVTAAGLMALLWPIIAPALVVAALRAVISRRSWLC